MGEPWISFSNQSLCCIQPLGRDDIDMHRTEGNTPANKLSRTPTIPRTCSTMDTLARHSAGNWQHEVCWLLRPLAHAQGFNSQPFLYLK